MPDASTATIQQIPADLQILFEKSDAFRRWLERRAPGTNVGFCGDPAECPIADWLTFEGMHQASVGKRDVDGYWHDQWVKVELPEWCQRFIRAVDAEGLLQPLRAYQALTLLSHVAQTRGPSA